MPMQAIMRVGVSNAGKVCKNWPAHLNLYVKPIIGSELTLYRLRQWLLKTRVDFPASALPLP